MPPDTLENLAKRLTALEQEMMQVKAQIRQQTRQPHPWLDHVYGAFQDDPLFEDAVRYGRAWREAQNSLDAEAQEEQAAEDGANDVPAGHG